MNDGDLLDLERRVFQGDAYWGLGLLDIVAAKSATVMFASRNGKRVGMCVYWEDEPSHSVHIGKLGVDPEHRRRGVATELLETLCRRCRDRAVTLHVSTTNVAARNLYLKNRFARERTAMDYYGTGKHAFVMKREC